MADRLPPLKAIHYFAVAARHLSFSKAADELHVTHSAISHQIKLLEEFLGIALFRRANRQVMLTDSGQAYLKPVKEAFDKLADASRQLARRETSGPLTVSTLPSFAAKWLVPRLRNFQRDHPDIDVRVQANNRLTDFAREEIDLALRYGRGNWSELEIVPLMREDLFPVCSPEMIKGPRALKRPADLAEATLLMDYDWATDFWPLWLNRAGVAHIKPNHHLSFNYSNLMIQAAIDGLGVALTPGVLVEDDLAAGRLVKPFDISVSTEANYYLVAPLGAFERPKLAAFRDWLLREAEATRYRALAPGA